MPYCFDESDEEDCTEVCTEDQFRCVDGSGCIPLSKVCDRMNDCDNGSDEKDCSESCGLAGLLKIQIVMAGDSDDWFLAFC